MITYTSSINEISIAKLDGFFVGWAKPLTLLLQYSDNWCGFVVEDQ